MAFFEEITKRRVLKIVAIYLGTAWVCIEAVNFFVEKYGLSEGLFQAALNLAIGSLPAVVIYSWYHGEAGRQAFHSRELVLYSINALLIMFLVWKGWQLAPQGVRTADSPLARSIAVLPFQNLSDDPEQEYIADGITEDIISRISQIPGFKVISRTSSFHYKHSDKTLTEIGQELQVGNILEGSTRRSGDVMRISVKLVNAQTDRNLWAETFDRKITETFVVQSEVASRIASALQLKLSDADEERLKEASNFNIEAYENYQRGMHYLRQEGTEEDLNDALLYFKLALKADSAFFLSYVGIAQTYVDFSFWGRESAASVVPRAKEAIQHALELNNRSGKVYEAMANIALNFDNDVEAAERYLRRALELEPGYANTYYHFSQYYILTENKDEALRNLDKAIELDPLYFRFKVWKANTLYTFGEHKEAFEIIDNVLRSNPRDNHALWSKGLFYLAERKYTDAIATFRDRSVAASTNWALGLAYGLTGQGEEAGKIFSYQLEKSKLQYVPPAILGVGYYSIGHYREAQDLLAEQFLSRDGGVEWQLILSLLPLDSLEVNPLWLTAEKKNK